jgi:hypothetical protein
MSGSNKERPCIYTVPKGLCAGGDDLSAEDYLPRGLGKFKGYERLKGKICRRCNHDLGELDALLLTSGPEAIFRAIYGIEGRKTHRKRDSFHEMTHGRPPVEVWGRLPGDTSDTRLEVLRGNFGQPRRELIFESHDGTSCVVTVPLKIDTPDKLQEHLKRKSVGRDWRKCVVNCPADDEGFQEMVQRCLGKIEQLGKPSDRRGYPAIVPVASLIQLSPEYYRAIAKIAFHFFIWCSFTGITGLENVFDGIKEFIWRGDQAGKYMRSTAGPFDRNEIGDAPYAHVLSAGVVGNEAVATVQLFAGSDSGINLIAGATDGRSFPVQLKNMSFVWIVKLGRSPFRIACDLRRALAFVAYRRTTDGFVGEVRELTPARSIVVWRPGFGPQFWA